MRTAWAVAVAGLFIVATGAYADTVYLKDGQTVWGREVTEQGDTVVVVRPGETLRFPKRDVDRIDRWRLSVPKYYEPPTTGEGSGSRQLDGPAAAPPAPAAEPRASTGAPAPPPAVPPVSTPAPAERTPTRLPPPPPPSPDKPR